MDFRKVRQVKQIKILPHFDPMVWVLSNGAEETSLQQFLLSSLYLFDYIFSSIVWIDSSIIVLKEFVSVFNKKTEKKIATFHGNGCKEEKYASSITRIL